MPSNDADLVHAIALYNTTADNPDELSFSKHDVLTVIRQQTESLGWWECQILKNNETVKGLVPANRLKIIEKEITNSGTSNRAPTPENLSRNQLTLSPTNFDAKIATKFDTSGVAESKNSNLNLQSGTSIRSNGSSSMKISRSRNVSTKSCKNYQQNRIKAPVKRAHSKDSILDTSSETYSLPRMPQNGNENLTSPMGSGINNNAGISMPLTNGSTLSQIPLQLHSSSNLSNNAGVKQIHINKTGIDSSIDDLKDNDRVIVTTTQTSVMTKAEADYLIQVEKNKHREKVQTDYDSPELLALQNPSNKPVMPQTYEKMKSMQESANSGYSSAGSNNLPVKNLKNFKGNAEKRVIFSVTHTFTIKS